MILSPPPLSHSSHKQDVNLWNKTLRRKEEEKTKACALSAALTKIGLVLLTRRPQPTGLKGTRVKVYFIEELPNIQKKEKIKQIRKKYKNTKSCCSFYFHNILRLTEITSACAERSKNNYIQFGHSQFKVIIYKVFIKKNIFKGK